jgi:hypothetical protein
LDPQIAGRLRPWRTGGDNHPVDFMARDRVQELKTAGKSADEIAASKPLADLDPVWGHGMLSSDLFVQMIYSAL